MNALLPVSIGLAPLVALGCAAFARWMRSRGVGQQIRELGPQGHAVKAGTPPMGGLVVLSSWAVAVVCLWPAVGWARPVGFVLAAGAAHGALGLVDDLVSLLHRRSLGLTVAWKLVLGSIAAVGLFFAFRDVACVPQRIPFSESTAVLPSVASFALVWVSLIATTNSMNLADGLDGLAGGLAVLVLVGLLLLSPSRAVLTVVAPLLGALVGFLWMNAHPARIILGDVGAFGLGAIVAALSLSTGTVFFLPLAAGVLVLEAASVVLQVASYKIAGVRWFKMSPLHHHFEASVHARAPHILPGRDWPEPKVTVRFWLAEALFVALALWAAYAP